MAQDTLNFVNEGLMKAQANNPDIDRDSFFKGAEYIINHLIEKGRL